MLKIFFESLINLIKFINLDKKKKEFVFFSESKFYRNYFIDLILNLKKLGQKNIILITSDKDDVTFFKDTLTCLYIKNYFILSIFFKMLNCKFMIMTLTDLGNHFQKSKLCKFYVYFFHAIASTHKVYTHSAFKNYDIIFANGNYQVDELRFAEKEFGFKKKEIIHSGYFFLDNLKKKANLNLKEERNILFAPSWNYNRKNLFDDYVEKIISDLLFNNFKVTLRPHPEHYKRSEQTIIRIDNKFSNNKNFFLDRRFSNLKSLEKAEILITDNSAIVFEYMFVFKRPIIYLNYIDKIHNLEINKIKISTIDEKFKNKFGNSIDFENLSKLIQICEKLIEKSNISKNEVEIFEKDQLFNLGNSAYYAANYLIKKSK